MLAICAYGFYALLAAAAVIDARERRLPHGLGFGARGAGRRVRPCRRRRWGRF